MTSATHVITDYAKFYALPDGKFDVSAKKQNYTTGLVAVAM